MAKKKRGALTTSVSRRELFQYGIGTMVATRLSRVAAKTSQSDSTKMAQGRPHTEFIQVQTVPAHALLSAASKPFTLGKPLSYDSKGNRAVTQTVQFPPKWTHNGEHYIDSEEEFFVVSGQLIVDGEVFNAGSYATFPAGLIRKSQASPQGALVLFCFDGPHRAVYDAPSADLYEAGSIVGPIATPELPWHTGSDEDKLAWGDSAQRILLRREETNGEETWLLHVPSDAPDLSRSPVIHDNVEEMFVLSGEVSTPRGTLTAGGYVWRVPGRISGPSGTRTGFTAFMRSKGGALNTRLIGSSVPVNWAAQYNPDIAAGHRDWAFTNFDRTQLF